MSLPESIQNLQIIFSQHVVATSIEKRIPNEFVWCTLTLEGLNFQILVDDEYQDFTSDTSLMNWFLILQSLELYDESDDVVQWCKQRDLNVAEYVTYYRVLRNTYQKIERIIGTIDAQINPWDYQMRTCVIEQLEKF